MMNLSTSTPQSSAASETPVADPSVDASLELIKRAQAGQPQAIEELFQRCVPALRRWARGRLPNYARDLADTQDVVQDAMVSTFNRLGSFEQRHPGSLHAYLRQAVVNRIRDEIRRVTRRGLVTELDDQRPDTSPSPLHRAIERESLARYEAALQLLRASDREAIIARVERQQSYDEIAVQLGKPNANAARVAVTRAIAKLVAHMSDRPA